MICGFVIFLESIGSRASLSAETSRKSEVKKTSDFFMPTTRPGTARLSSISRVPGERRPPIIGHFRQNRRMTLLLFGAIPHLRAPSGKGIYFKYKSRKFSSIFFLRKARNFFFASPYKSRCPSSERQRTGNATHMPPDRQNRPQTIE